MLHDEWRLRTRACVCMDGGLDGGNGRKLFSFLLIVLCFGQCAKEQLRHLHVMNDDDAPFVLCSLRSSLPSLPSFFACSSLPLLTLPAHSPPPRDEHEAPGTRVDDRKTRREKRKRVRVMILKFGSVGGHSTTRGGGFGSGEEEERHY
jgi:hypothetical protein